MPQTRWRKSSYSNDNGQCCEVAAAPSAFLVRDSKNPNGAWLTFGASVFTRLLSDVKSGEYDL